MRVEEARWPELVNRFKKARHQLISQTSGRLEGVRARVDEWPVERRMNNDIYIMTTDLAAAPAAHLYVINP